MYDALNVFEALGLIKKEKKKIIWRGMDEQQSTDTLKAEIQRRKEKLEEKQKDFQELIYQYISLNNLINRNKTQNTPKDPSDSLECPFMVFNYGDGRTIEFPSIDMDPSGHDVAIKFPGPFEIVVDTTILKTLGFTSISYEKLKSILPPEYLQYLPESFIDKSKKQEDTY